jgi:tripartite-type tricarboxylate transporter receptor subunit TctC
MLITSAAALAAAATAHAQQYPTRPVRIIVAQAPGSAVDILGRLIAQKLGESFGQQVIIDNRPGANGIIGMEAAAKARPDGYTLAMVVPSAMTVNQYIYRKLPYEPLRDFAPVTQSSKITFGLIANASLPARSVKDLVALGKAHPNDLSYGSAGVGNLSHLAGELFNLRTGLRSVHVPNKGETPAVLDVVTGQTAYMLTPMPSTLAFVESGKLRLLAVCGASRAASHPRIPTLAEAGVRDVVIEGWTGLAAPAGTPAAIVSRLQQETAKHIRAPELSEFLAKQGAESVGSTPEAFAAFIRSEAGKWSQVIQRAGLASSQ